MRTGLVYDLPTRLFHWLFAGLFVTAFVIAKNVNDESPVFAYHMLAGLVLGFTVLLRIVWGFVGTRHSRFNGFALNPSDLLAYFSGLLSGDRRKWAGHNPASSWAAIVMMVSALGLALTGYQMSTGKKEAFEDIHELLADAFVVVALLHVAGVVLHTLRHRDMVGLSMMDGRKADVASEDLIAGSRAGVGLLFLALVATFFFHLVRDFDTSTNTLNLFGTSLQLGENEGESTKSGD